MDLILILFLVLSVIKTMMNQSALITIFLSSILCASAYVTPSTVRTSITVVKSKLNNNDEIDAHMISRRKALISTQIVVSSIYTASLQAYADENVDDGTDSFQSIAARAAKISSATTQVDENEIVETPSKPSDPRTIYDFSLPIAGRVTPISDLIGQNNTYGTDSKVKAILFVNIKQDDPIARKNIPELITLAAKFGRNGEFVVVCSPTDQGYYEPDTSQLIRLKLTSEYGYGINPSTIVTDKVNFLGTGAHPFWRWMEGKCRTPSGIGKIQGNFEKFLVDGRTGLPLRRYPRKYQPFDITNDIDAVIKGKPLSPAVANWKEEWRIAERDAERDTYRFQKGLNVFDQ